MKFISHRGAAGLEQENTLAAIKQGDHYRPLYIEIDINLTTDNQLVVHHGKLSRGYRDIPLTQSMAELVTDVPSLLSVAQLLKTPPKAPLLIDLKSREATTALLPLIDTDKTLRRAAYTSPHIESLRLIHKKLPNARIFVSQPYHESPLAQFNIARRYGFSGISLNKWWLSPLIYWLAGYMKLELMVYTVNRTFTMRLINFFFPRVFVCTNHPERASVIL